MAVFLLMFGAVGLGFGLIFLIAVFSPQPPKIDLKAESGGSPFVELDAEELGKLTANLLDKMGLEIERIQGGKNEIYEIYAENPTPITGGKILVHCIPAPTDTGKLTGLAVQKFIRAVRTAYVSKGLLFTTGTFTPDAHLEAEETPIELFDRTRIAAMVNDHFEEGDPDALVQASVPAPENGSS